MSQDKIDMLHRALAREKAARKQAEKILEIKAAELYEANQKLETSYLELEALLNKTDSQLQGVFENIVDAYVIMDLFGNILKMNDAAVDLLGFLNANENANLMDMVHQDDLKLVSETFQNLIAEGAVTDSNFRIITKEQTEKLVHVNASIIYDNGEPVAAQGIVRDITERNSLQIQKEKLLQKLEKSNNELQEYAHIVSHDLKSPLRSLDALVHWIKEDNQDTLDAASLQNFDLIETTLEKLQQLFQNLISNAIKFIDKDAGLVEIDVKDNGTHYEFYVKDNGIGIDEKFHDKIFKLFHALNKSKDSTGIGLSIVKKIVDLHEGDIWLESEPGKGTKFFFTLKK